MNEIMRRPVVNALWYGSWLGDLISTIEILFPEIASAQTFFYLAGIVFLCGFVFWVLAGLMFFELT